MPVYVLRHPKPGFRGVVAGVDFFNGIGSTSNEGDKDFLASKIGCETIETIGKKSEGAGLPAPAASGLKPDPNYRSVEAAFVEIGVDIASQGKATAASASLPAQEKPKRKPGPKPKMKE